MKQKTILIEVHQAFALRYLLRTSFFSLLKNRDDMRIVIYSQYCNEDYFKKEFESSNVFLEYYDVNAITRYMSQHPLFSFFYDLRSFGINTSHLIYLKRKKRFDVLWKRSFKGKAYALLFWIITFCMQRSRWLRKYVVQMENKLFPGMSCKELFKKYTPDLVITCSPGYFIYDVFLLRQAKLCGIRTACFILSWDNTSTKGLPGCETDTYVVWTESIKKEMVVFYGIAPEQIFVGGIMHFDIYYDARNFLNKKDLAKMLGFSAYEKVILFCMGFPKRFHEKNMKIAHALAQANENGTFGPLVRILIRPHPNYFNPEKWHASSVQNMLNDEFKKYTRSGLFMPQIKQIGNGLLDFDQSDQKTLASSLYHATMIVSCFSTVNIEASIIDKPIVNASFHEYQETIGTSMSDARYYTHNKRLVDAECIALADSVPHMITLILRYLSEPKHEHEGRMRIRETEAGPFGGHACKACAEYIRSLMIDK